MPLPTTLSYSRSPLSQRLDYAVMQTLEGYVLPLLPKAPLFIHNMLIVLLCDKHERLVPDIMDWYITEADINKDIKVSDLLHFSATKIQVKHLDHLFRIYIKSMGEDTVCRVEESKHHKKPAIEFINDVFNPTERLFLDQDKKKYQVSSDKVENVAITGGSTTDVIDWRGGSRF